MVTDPTEVANLVEIADRAVRAAAH